jgi:hypothetical protein
MPPFLPWKGGLHIELESDLLLVTQPDMLYSGLSARNPSG